MMSDHWKLLANLLGTPGPVDPNPSDTSAKPAAPAKSQPAATTAPVAAPTDRDPLAAMTAKEPDKLVPGFEIPEPPATPEKPARRSAWDTLIGTLGIKVSEEVETEVAAPQPTSAPEPKLNPVAEAKSPARTPRSSSFGAGLVGDSDDDQPRSRTRENRGSHLSDEAVPSPPKPKTGPVWRDEEQDVPPRRSAESNKPKRTGFADGLIDWDPTGDDDVFVSDSDDFAGDGDEFETVADKDAASDRDSDDRPRRRGRRGRGRNRGRDREDREPRVETRDDAFVDDVDSDDLVARRDDFDLDDEPADVPARDDATRDDAPRGDSRRRGRRGERQRLGEPGSADRAPVERTPVDRTSGDRAPRDRAGSERSSGDRPVRGERAPRGERVPRERTPLDRPSDSRGPADRTRQSPTSLRSDFDFDDDLDVEEISGADDSSPAARTEREPGDRPRRRRGRRGRGGSGRDGASRDTERAASSTSHGLRDPDNDFDDEPPFAPELAVDELEPVGTLDDDHEDHEDVEQMRRGRRRRRGGRGRGGDRGPERTSDDLPTSEAPRGDDAFAAPARQRSVPTWLDTVNLLVDANIERHRRSGGNSRQGSNRGPRR